MVEIQPLINFSPRPEDDFRLHGLPIHPPIQGADGAYYGHEWARWRYDSLDVRVDQLLQDAPRPVPVLDLGCATGSRAAAFAQLGCAVTAVDILDRSGEIAARTADLACQAGTGTIRFEQADLRTWPAATGEVYRLVHARRVINFMTMDEAGRLFGRLRNCLSSEGAMAVSFIAVRLPGVTGSQTPVPTGGSVRLAPGLDAHDFDAIVALLRVTGFVVSEAFSDGACDAGFIVRPR